MNPRKAILFLLKFFAATMVLGWILVLAFPVGDLPEFLLWLAPLSLWGIGALFVVVVLLRLLAPASLRSVGQAAAEVPSSASGKSAVPEALEKEYVYWHNFVKMGLIAWPFLMLPLYFASMIVSGGSGAALLAGGLAFPFSLLCLLSAKYSYANGQEAVAVAILKTPLYYLLGFLVIFIFF